MKVRLVIDRTTCLHLVFMEMIAAFFQPDFVLVCDVGPNVRIVQCIKFKEERQTQQQQSKQTWNELLAVNKYFLFVVTSSKHCF